MYTVAFLTDVVHDLSPLLSCADPSLAAGVPRHCTAQLGDANKLVFILDSGAKLKH